MDENTNGKLFNKFFKIVFSLNLTNFFHLLGKLKLAGLMIWVNVFRVDD